jgi:hypothetical protein
MARLSFKKKLPSQGLAATKLMFMAVLLFEGGAELFAEVFEDFLLAALVFVNFDGGYEGDRGAKCLCSLTS